MVLHFLGDPIDSLWSLAAKLEVWSNFDIKEFLAYDTSEKVLGTLVGAMEELIKPGEDPDPVKALDRLLPEPKTRNPKLVDLMDCTALKLADSRTNDILRTWLAILLYFYQVISTFVNALGGGESSVPSGRIGTALFMTWIIPTILLSNYMGGFTSSRSCFRIMQQFAAGASKCGQGNSQNQEIQRSQVDQVEQDGQKLQEIQRTQADQVEQVARENQENQGDEENLASTENRSSEQFLKAIAYDSQKEYFSSQCWSGAVYTYRPHKKVTLALVFAVLPILISTATAQAIIWYNPPNAVGCRGIMFLAFLSAYFVSAFTTWSTKRFSLLKEKGRRRLMLVKDALIALGTIILVFISTAGLFNSCWCASNAITLGQNAPVVLNNTPDLMRDNKVRYKEVFFVGLGMQIFVFSWISWNGRKGLRLMRWSEKCKENAFSRLTTHEGRL